MMPCGCRRWDPAPGTAAEDTMMVPTAAREGNKGPGLSLGQVPCSLIVQHLQAFSSCKIGGRGAS